MLQAEASPPARAQRSWLLATPVAPTLLAVVGAVLVGVLGVRGADYPAHFMRAELWRQVGLSVWNFHWYGGHPTTTYSIIVPPLTALLGVFTVSALASVLGTWWFSRLMLAYTRGPWAIAGLVAFALTSTVNVVVGRVPFAVGLACAMAAADQWRRGRLVTATVAAVLVPLASPVAATFVCIATAAWIIDARLDRRWNRSDVIAAWLLAGSTVPLVIVSTAFRTEGRFPFRGDQAVLSIALLVILAVVTRERVVRIGALLAVAASVVVFVVPNPLGGNFVRFTQFVVIPLAMMTVGFTHHSRRMALALVVTIGAGWSLQSGAVAALDWSGDESISEWYHEPLVDEVQLRNRDGEPIGRLEIPFTENHWEAYFVASEVPFARGWERQIDLDRNAVLYDPALTPAAYRTWLEESAVRWVAVPDATVDEGGLPEVELIASGRVDDLLTRVWHNRHWTLYEVTDYQPIVDPPANLVAERADSIVVSTPESASVIARYTGVEGVTIMPDGCVVVVEGAMRLDLPRAGTYTISVGAGAMLPGDDVSSCEPDE